MNMIMTKILNKTTKTIIVLKKKLKHYLKIFLPRRANIVARQNKIERYQNSRYQLFA